MSKAVRSNLLSLQNTADLMAKTQERLATGNKVNSALDNPTNFFTASALNSRAGDLNALMDNMANGIKTLEAADNGLTSITKTLESMQSTLRQARQDKSFQVDTYEVNKLSTLKVNGGRFGAETEIRLQEPTGGTKATLAASVPGVNYVNPPATAGTLEGPGPRTLIEYDPSFDDGGKIRIDGKELTIGTPGSNDASGVAAAINTAMGPAGITGYTVSSSGNKIIIEANDKTVSSPDIEFVAGITTAKFGETSFIYNKDNVGTVKAGGQNISTGGGTFSTFVSSLQENAEAGGYEVSFDIATQRITLKSTTQGGPAPTIEGLRENGPATGASQAFEVNIGSLGPGSTAFGVTFATGVASAADLAARLNADPAFAGRHATADGSNLIVTNTTTGASSPAISTTSGNPGVSAVAGGAVAGTDAISDGISVTRLAGVNGAYTEAVEAASHKFTLTYGTKSAEINVVGRDGSPHAQANQLKLINDQLLAAGLYDIEASFDANDQLVFKALTEESKTLAVSGENSTDLFGTTTVSTGSPAVSAYKSSNAVDQFVEEINRNPDTAGYIRASNDNGKLRIENLSTQELSVELDKDGDGVGSPTNHKIAGNATRANLASEFNELKNQLDRLADDASFNGINLLRGDNLRITFNESGNSFIEIQSKDGAGISANTLDLRHLNAIDLDADMDIDKLLDGVKLALSSVRSQASKFGSNLSIVQNRQSFTKQMINTLETGAANLTLADMNEEAANLLALQTRQSLSSSSLSLASQADQSVLQLLQ
ncbi:MAG: hypothetical protein ABS76_02480 [Pelagibacterium sp. SCN 64-44]|nr:MAG: hypothetical protein ABS76_02480 [Pelagibacterium sp. SCN 64-44]